MAAKISPAMLQPLHAPRDTSLTIHERRPTTQRDALPSRAMYDQTEAM